MNGCFFHVGRPQRDFTAHYQVVVVFKSDNLSVGCVLTILELENASGCMYGFRIFPVDAPAGQRDLDESNALEGLTGLSDPTMQGMFVIVTTLAGITAVALAAATNQVAPIGVYLFGEVFWTSYIRLNSIVTAGGYVPVEFVTIFFVATLFLFIAAVIGMFTGSG